MAAFWTDAQRIEAELALTNLGDEPLELLLDATVSHQLWEVTVGEPTVSLAPGETRTVPVGIRVAPDAWAEQPMRITVRARTNPDDDGDAAGATRTAFLDVTPRQDAPPVNPEPGWSLPPALR